MKKANKMKKRSIKFIFPVFILIFSLILSSCGNSVSYTVEKAHEDKIKVIYNMIKGLVKDDSELYLSTFEPSYIENVKKVVDTLGLQYFDAENFDSLISDFFRQTGEGLTANYGKKFNVKLTFNSVEEVSKDTLGEFFDDYSVGYKFPKDNIQAVSRVSVKIHISGDDYEEIINSSFTLLKLSEKEWYLHPESFLFSF